ncbi:MAG: MFS transporter [Phycisphaerales bacterium]|nr:MFS transporter [Phycisphaerales bacterium]
MNAIPAPRMGFGLGSRLSFMMFLQYAIWGAWLPLLWPFLHDYRGFSSGDIGWMFMAGGVGAIIGPFIAGQVADRWFNTEKYLGLSHIAGAIVVWQLAWIESYWAFFAMSIVYSVIYAPTLALTNSLAFHHMPDRDRDFGKVRLWGTVGWIAVGIGIGQWLLHSYSSEETAVGMMDAFKLSAIIGAIMGVYCFTLPKTPPQRGEEASATAEAIREVRRNPLLTLFLIAVPVSMIHQFYFVYTSGFLGQYQTQAEGAIKAINSVFGVGGGGLMTIGQMAEILVLFLIPFVAGKWSRKTLLAIGLCAYTLRMFLFSQVEWINSVSGMGEIGILIAGIALHGLCFGCFIFVAFMVVDEECTGDVKASAQNLFNLVIVGIGIVLGSYVAGQIGDWATTDGVIDWSALFSIPMYAAIVCLGLLLAFYPNRPHTHVWLQPPD